jgi:MOSC domain-containing protein YiiM
VPADLDHVRAAPVDDGELRMIVLRPAADARVVIDSAEVRVDVGLVGDNWRDRGGDDPEDQVTIMSIRALEAITDDRDLWPLAGDQLYVDLDLTEDNLPTGTRLAVGGAVFEVSALPHTGCKKFAARFGPAATRLINTGEGKRLRMRGIHASVVQEGVIAVGDRVTKVLPPA